MAIRFWKMEIERFADHDLSVMGSTDLEALIKVEICLDALRVAQDAKDFASASLECDRLVRLYETGSEEVRFRIVAGSGSSMPGDQRRQLLEQALRHDPSGLVRHEAAFALSNFPDDACESLLCSVGLKDQNYLVRHEAAIALMTVGTVRALRYLENGLLDCNNEVIVSCRLAISSIHYRAKHRNRSGTPES